MKLNWFAAVCFFMFFKSSRDFLWESILFSSTFFSVWYAPGKGCWSWFWCELSNKDAGSTTVFCTEQTHRRVIAFEVLGLWIILWHRGNLHVSCGSLRQQGHYASRPRHCHRESQGKRNNLSVENILSYLVQDTWWTLAGVLMKHQSVIAACLLSCFFTRMKLLPFSDSNLFSWTYTL